MNKNIGPNARKFLSREKKCFTAIGSRHFPSLVISKGEGATLTDVDGNPYLDLIQSVNTIGHGHPKIIAAIEQQISKLVYYSGAAALNESYLELAEKLRKLSLDKLKDAKVAYCTSGTEACDFSIRLARFYSKRPIIVSYQGSYHGLTSATLSISASSPSLKKHTIPLISEVMYAPYPYCYRCLFKRQYPECGLLCLKYIEKIIDTTVNSENIAAFIIEPIQMHGGVVIPPENYLLELKKSCKEHDILLIDDEVYTALGKTGAMLAIEHYNMEPDIICFGKALGGGLPLGAILARKEIIDAWETDGIGGSLGTLAGAPVACAASLANIEFILEEDLMKNAIRIGGYIRKYLNDLAEEVKLIGDVRGKGLLIGVELVKDRITKKPAVEEAMKVVSRAFERGLLLGTCGLYKQVLEITPPLILTEEQADDALIVLSEVLKQLG